MREVIFIGDAVTAAGFRLAGVPCFAPPPERLVSVVTVERADCAVLIMTAATLAALPAALAREIENADQPLLALVSDAQETVAVPDLEPDVRRALGIEV